MALKSFILNTHTLAHNGIILTKELYTRHIYIRIKLLEVAGYHSRIDYAHFTYFGMSGDFFSRHEQ